MLAIVLDLDDTLYLERDYVRSGIAAVDDWVRKVLNVRGFGEAASASFADGRRERLFDAAFEMIGVQPSAMLVARAVHEYRRHRPAIGLAPDSKDFLDRCAGFPLALITDGSALSQRMKVSALGLRGRMSSIVYTDDWGRAFWKPHLRAYEHVEAMLGRGHPFLYIADNPAKDFVGPRALGWRTVQIARRDRLHRGSPPTDGHRADVMIETFDELSLATLRDLVPQIELMAAR